MTTPVKALKELKEIITGNVDFNKELYLSASHDIHERPEIGNEEFFASARLIKILEDEGFEVERAVAGHETSFVARKKFE